MPPPPAGSAATDPTLDHLREQFAAGHVEAARAAVLQLSPQGRSEIEARLGAATVARMVRAARKVRTAVLGRVVVVHGIMGGKLATVDPSGDEDLVWMHYLRLVAGRIEDLTLDSNAEPLDPRLRVVTQGLLDEYMPLVFELSQRWRVLPFAFDWRLNIDGSAAQLDREIRRWSGGEPTHVVAHSMGGLVARRFMQLFPATWEAMKDPVGLRRGGRLVMLGTPNRGSFAIPLVLTGQERTLKLLAAFDLKHDMKEILNVVNTFPGSYQMLPSPASHAGDDRLRLYDAAEWGGFPVPQKYLDLGRRFQEEMEAVQDPQRLVYVAGCNQPTLHGIRIDGPGRFSYRETLDGDGRVPHELGLLPGVQTLYVEEVHGDLPANQRVLAGIHELLLTGNTAQLLPFKPAKRDLPPSPAWRTPDQIEPMPPALPATRAAFRSLNRDDAAAVESALLASFVGGREIAKARATATSKAADDARARSKARPGASRRAPLVVEVVWADITQVDGQVLAAGHYEGVEPQAGELALDRAVSGVAPGDECSPDALLITSHTRRGILRGAVGDINFFPWMRRRKTVAIAGMGHPGTFGVTASRRTARALAESLVAMPKVETACTLLIGSGNGNLDVPGAVKALIEGFEDALHGSLQNSSLQRIRIVERDLRKAQLIAEALHAHPPVDGMRLDSRLKAGRGGAFGEQIAVSAILLAAALRVRGDRSAAGKAAAAVLQGVDASAELRRGCEDFLRGLPVPEDADLLLQAGNLGFGRLPRGGAQGRAPTRMSFVRDNGGSGIRSAAISDSAVVAERIVPVDWSLVDEIIRRTTDPQDLSELPGMSRLMATLLVQRDFREKLDMGDSLIVEVDRSTARIHWELLENFHDAKSQNPLGLDKPMARQMRTSYSPTPPRPYTPRDKLRALVIGDPGDPDQGLSLEGARSEALEVTALLRGMGIEVDALIGAPNVPRVGPLLSIPAATIFDVLWLMNSHDYDILHFAGHGVFDPEQPDSAGWLFGDRCFTGREIANLRTIPTLVVANACLSSQTSNLRADASTPGARPSDDTLLPTLVDEFFMRGVRNYIGTAWEVSDTGAALFSQVLYKALLDESGGATPSTLGQALRAARMHLRSRQDAFGALWAAYQHYGDPDVRLRVLRHGTPSDRAGGDPRSADAMSSRGRKRPA